MDNQDKCLITLSAFGPFGSVLNNPTMELLKNLPEKIKQAYNVQIAEILEVSTKGCDQHVGNVCKLNEKCSLVVNLHFGVYAGAENIQFEKCGYNLKSFSIPDVLGYQPIGEKIDVNKQKNDPIHTLIDLDRLFTNMKHRGFKKLLLSSDPGRYICNYMYYTSLQKQCQNQTSLFTHVPLFDEIPFDQQMDFLIQLLEEIQQLYKAKQLLK